MFFYKQDCLSACLQRVDKKIYFQTVATVWGVFSNTALDCDFYLLLELTLCLTLLGGIEMKTCKFSPKIIDDLHAEERLQCDPMIHFMILIFLTNFAILSAATSL